MLARNSDLWRLAASSCRLLSAISRNSRAFWIARADWVANVVSSAHDFRREVAGRLADDGQGADDLRPPGAAARPRAPDSPARSERVSHRALVGARDRDVGHVDGSAMQGRAARPRPCPLGIGVARAIGSSVAASRGSS